METPETLNTDALLQRIEELEQDNRELRARLRDQSVVSHVAALRHEAQDREHAQEISSATSRIETLQNSRASLQASEKKLRQIADNLPP